MNRSQRRQLRHRHRTMTGLGVIGVTGALFAATPGLALAEEETGTLTEVVVTARKKEERLQDVPSTVAAITGSDLQDAGARKLADLATLTSGISYVGLGGAQTLVSVRGDSNRIGSSEVGTGIFVDGVFVPRASALGVGPVDVQRVEFLKGPQSTLYGKNTIAGAINIITNDPTWDLSGEIEAGYGGSSQDGERLYHVQGVISGPIIADKVAVRFTAAHSERDGYLSDPFSGQRGLGYDATDLRLKIWMKPADGVDWRITASYREDDAPRMEIPVPGSGTTVAASRPGTPPATSFSSIWHSRTDVPLYSHLFSRGLTSDLSVETPLGVVTSLTNYQTIKSEFLADSDTTQFFVASSKVRDKARTFSQELRIAGSEGPVSWLGGLFYFRDKVPVTEQTIVWGPASNNNANGIGRQYSFSPVSTTTKAIFGQVGYDLTDRFNITGGLRYAEDKKEGDLQFTLFNLAGGFLRDVVPRLHREAKFSGLTGNVVASYKMTDEAMIYASYGTGSKAGGFAGAGSAATAVIPFDEAKVKASEVGLKTDWLDRRLRINVAAFNNDYDNLQLTQTAIIGGVTANIITNAAKARAYGLDGEVHWALTPELRLDAAYTYLHARIKEYQIAPGVVFGGFAPPRNPTHSGVVALTYTKDLGEGELRLKGDVNFKSRFNNDINRTATNQLLLAPASGYHVFNAGAAYSWDNYEISAYVRNIANKEYYIAQVITFVGSYYYGTPGEPRTFEVTLKARF